MTDRRKPSGKPVSVFGTAVNRRDIEILPPPDIRDERIFGPESVTAGAIARYSPARAFEALTPVRLSAAHLAQNLVYPNASDDPLVAAFDVLRTSVLLGLSERKWRRVGVTSPMHGNGKTLVAANLAMSLARRSGSRTLLMDLDLRHPGLVQKLGIHGEFDLPSVLSGERPFESALRRFGQTLALGLNSFPKSAGASEVLHSEDTHEVIGALIDAFEPEVVLFDLPPILVTDDVLAMAPSLDSILLVTDGTRSSPKQIEEAEKRLRGRVPLLGVVLNRAQDLEAGRFGYGRS